MEHKAPSSILLRRINNIEGMTDLYARCHCDNLFPFFKLFNKSQENQHHMSSSDAPALQPQVLNAMKLDGDLKVTPAAEMMRALPKNSRQIVGALAATSPFVRYALGINADMWTHEQEVMDERELERKNKCENPEQYAIENKLPWTSASNTFFVDDKTNQVVLLPSLRTRLVGSTDGDSHFAAGVPEYNLNLKLKPFKRDGAWVQTTLKKVEAFGPCIRSFNAEFNRHANDLSFRDIAAAGTLESISLMGCPIPMETFFALAEEGNFRHLRTLRLGILNFNTAQILAPDAFVEHFPMLKELALHDVKEARVILESIPAGTLNSLSLVNTDCSVELLTTLLTEQPKLQHVSFISGKEIITSDTVQDLFLKLEDITSLAVNASTITSLIKANVGVNVGKIREVAVAGVPTTLDMMELCKNFMTRLTEIVVIEASKPHEAVEVLNTELEKIRGGIKVTAVAKKEWYSFQ